MHTTWKLFKKNALHLPVCMMCFHASSIKTSTLFELKPNFLKIDMTSPQSEMGFSDFFFGIRSVYPILK